MVDRACLCSTWVEDLNVAVGWERLEGDRTVGMQSVGSVLPDERGFEASICHGVGCELVARFFEESIVGEGVGDTAVAGRMNSWVMGLKNSSPVVTFCEPEDQVPISEVTFW